MQIEARTLRSSEGSNSNAYLPPLHPLSQSGFSQEPELAISVSTPETFGASELASAVGRKTMQAYLDILETEFFQRNCSIAQSLFERKLVGLERMLTAERQAPFAGADKTFSRLEHRIGLMLEFEPVEDGYTHSTEVYLNEVIQDRGKEAGSWLIELISGNRWNRSLAAELLRLVSRQKPFTENWRLEVIGSCLIAHRRLAAWF